MRNLWDMHCHILPGVDDGAQTLEESMQILHEEVNQGVSHIILTPHYRKRMFETSIDVIEEQYELLKKEVYYASKNGQRWASKLHLYLGCELHSCMNMLDLLEEGRCKTLGNSDCVLIEFSSCDVYTYIKERCLALRSEGYQPIIAHAERYETLRQKNYKYLEDLVDYGVLIQVNADSVLGENGFFTKRWCNKAIKKNLVHLIGSDAHDLEQRAPKMKACYDYIRKHHGRNVANDLMIYLAEKLFRDYND